MTLAGTCALDLKRFKLALLAGLLASSPAMAQAPSYGVALETTATAIRPGLAFDIDRYNYPNHGPNSLTANSISSAASYTNAFGTVTGAASASANLATGELKAYAAGSLNCIDDACVSGGGYAFANYFDTLSFNIEGATSTTVTPVMFAFESEGSFSNIRNTSDVMHIYQGQLITNANGAGAGFGGSYQTGAVSTFANGLYLASVAWLNEEADHFRLELVYNLVGANPTLLIDLKLFATAGYGAVADFSHTATVDLTLPQGVTYASASGTFLSDRGAAVAVPEPGAWALMVVGFAGAGVAMRRRRRVASSVAASTAFEATRLS